MEALQNRVRGDPRKHGVARNGVVVFQLTALCLCLSFWYFMFDRHIQGSDREGAKVDGQPVQLALLPEFEDIPNGMQSRQRATAFAWFDKHIARNKTRGEPCISSSFHMLIISNTFS